MATTIVTKSGSGAPTASDLVAGELAVDLTNGRLYTEDSGGTVLELGLNPNGNVDVTGSVTAGGTLSANNIRVGVALDAWGANSHVIQMGDGVSDSGALAWNTLSGADYFDLMYQSYFDGTDYKYAAAAAVSRISQRNGAITFDRKAAGSADATFTWDNSLTIDTSGNVGIGTASPSSARLQIKGTGTTVSTNAIFAENSAGAGLFAIRDNGEAFILGNVGIGGATGERLTVTAPNPTDGLVASLRNSGTSGLTGTKLWFNQNTVDNWNIGQPAGVNAFVFCNSTGSTAERMRIDASGNLGIGTSSPSSIANYVVLETQGDTTTTGGIYYSSSSDSSQKAHFYIGGGTGYLGTQTNHPLAFTTNNTTRMTLDASGNLLVNETGVSGNAEKFRITSGGTSSATAAALFNNSAGTELFFVRSDGAFRTGTAAVSPYNNTAAVTANCFINTDGTLLRATSSRRYKKDISDARFGLSDLLKLRPVNYKGINSEVDGDIVYGGLIAEEVHDAGLTEFVEYNKENQPDALRYQHMVSLCIKAIQEQQATIEALTARIAALES